MSRRWPNLLPRVAEPSGVLMWVGPLRGFQMTYHVQIVWDWRDPRSRPFVFVYRPALRPRPGGRLIDVPHLIYDAKDPEGSALCLFDPDEGEWRSSQWIADTSVPWASEWLHHYELWHFDGVWRGPNAPGPISVGEMDRMDKGAGDVERA